MKGCDLFVADPDDAGVIRRCYVPQFSKLGINIRLIEVKPSVQPPSAGVFKKSVYTGQRPVSVQDDLFNK